MGRAKRADVAGGLYHMLNRANRRDTIFHKEGDSEPFESVLEEAAERFELNLYSYSVMPNHWSFLSCRLNWTAKWADSDNG